MSRKFFAVVVAAVVLVPVLIVGLHGQGKDAPSAEKPQAAAADPFLDPTLGKEKPKAEKPAAAADDPFADATNPFADPTTSHEKPKADKPAPKADKPAPPVKATKKPAIAVRDPGPLRAGEKAILKALEEPASFDFNETPLHEVVAYLSQKYRIPVVLDKKGLTDRGTPTDTLVTSRLLGIPLCSALDLMLHELDLTWIVKSDVLLITTPEFAEQHLVIKTYDVADLVLPLSDFRYRKHLPTVDMDDPLKNYGYVGTMGMGGMGGGMPLPYGQMGDRSSSLTQVTAPRDYDYDKVIDLITSIIQPSTWDCSGGPGSIQRCDGMVVIRQNLRIHSEVETLLADLRAKKLGSPTILVELKWLWLDAKQHEQLVGGGKPAAAGQRSLAVDAKALDQLVRTVAGFRGQIACGSGQWIHLASGDRRSVIVSSIPVIGSGVGYQPVIQVPNVGIVVELRPSVAPGTTTALLDVQSTVTRWAKTQPPLLHVGGSWPPYSVSEGAVPSPPVQPGQPGNPAPAPPAGPKETTQEPGGSASSPVERPQMPAQQLATTLRVPLGKPVIVGAMTFAPDGDAGLDKAGDNPRQLYLIATTSVASEP